MMELHQHAVNDLPGLLAETDAVAAALRRSAREALVAHKRAGLPIVSWQEGRVTWIPAENIVIDRDDDLAPQSAATPDRDPGR